MLCANRLLTGIHKFVQDFDRVAGEGGKWEGGVDPTFFFFRLDGQLRSYLHKWGNNLERVKLKCERV